MGPAPRFSGDSLPAGLDATGGDSNPACTCGRFPARPVVPDGLTPRVLADQGVALACRRWPPTSAVPAVSLLRTAQLLREGRSPCQEPFPLSPVGFPPDDEGKNIATSANHEVFQQVAVLLIHRLAQPMVPSRVDRCTTRWMSWQGLAGFGWVRKPLSDSPFHWP